MSKEFSELETRLNKLMGYHGLAVINFAALETLLQLPAPNVMGVHEAKRNLAAMNRYKGAFNTAKDAYGYELQMTLARIFVAHKDSLYLEKLVNYVEQSRKKLTQDDYKEFQKDSIDPDELAKQFQGLGSEEIAEIKQDLKKAETSIASLKIMRDESLAHINLKPETEVVLTYQEMADLIVLSEKILNTLSIKHFQSSSHFKELEMDVSNDLTRLVMLARLETENPEAIRKLLESSEK